MIVNNKVLMNWSSRNKKRYESLGYLFTHMGDKFIININDLPNNSNFKIHISCDNCNTKKLVRYQDYLKYLKNGKYYCRKCANKLYSINTILETKLKNGISFAQWGINNIDKNFIDKYWSIKNILNPFKICYKSSRKIWIKCQEKDYHDDYDIVCYSFVYGSRCPYCNPNSGKTNILDTLGYIMPKVLELWSDKNIKSPYEYSSHSDKKVWWKCQNNIHKDYLRGICNSNTYDFRCPSCTFSKGELKIEKYLIKHNIKYNSQKTFNNLIGIGGGLLSYDFYLPTYNLLIEYQGEYHDGTISYKTTKQISQQKEHDIRKRSYAIKNKILLLEIWYYDFDNIEEILKNKT